MKPAPVSCGACLGTGRTPWQGRAITCAWCGGTGAEQKEEPMNKPIIQAGCMDCALTTKHNTVTKAGLSLRAHVTEWPDHRPLISDSNGWHRYWADS